MFSIASIICNFALLVFLLQFVNGQSHCVDKNTNWDNAGSGNTVYLDRHRLNCGSGGNVMSMFKLERSDSNPNQVRYKYRCCQLGGS